MSVGAKAYKYSGRTTYAFSPLSSVESPVPPPIATTRSPAPGRFIPAFDGFRESGISPLQAFFWRYIGRGFPGIGIKQFSKSRIFRKVLEVGIIAGLVTKHRIVPDGFAQMA